MTFTVWNEGKGNLVWGVWELELHLSCWTLRKDTYQRERRFLCGKRAKKPWFEGQIQFPTEKFPKAIWRATAHCEECVRIYEELCRLGMLAELSDADVDALIGERST